MKFLQHNPSDAKWDAYQKYLAEQSQVIPTALYDYAIAPWHYDHNDHRCLHDAWIQELRLKETVLSENVQDRRLDLVIEFLDAYHKGIITLTYTGVVRYNFDMLQTSQRGSRAHGDMLIDEIRAGDQPGIGVHEMLFSSGAILEIHHHDFEMVHRMF